MPSAEVGFVVTCEHGGNRIPRPFSKLFAAHRDVLASHRGWDPGALGLARLLAKSLGASLIESQTSRLVVDLNRSEHHRALFSTITRTLPQAERTRILDEHYRPYRAQVAAAVDSHLSAERRVVHISAHSFTPELDGEVRMADIGLLYDPRRAREATFCDAWVAQLAAALPRLTIRRNYPYRGNADGLTTSLRRAYRADRYLGIEVELNQRLVAEPTSYRRACTAICRTVAAVAASTHSSSDK